MYTEFFGLSEAPFSIAPNPHYLFMSQRHKEALAHLKYGVMSDGGFILLTGEVGTGKTTLCRCLLNDLPDNVDLAFVLNPRVTATELLATICDEFKLDYPDSATVKTLVDRLLAHLLDCHGKGRHAVLIIDEAQNLSRDLLEQLRLLTNLETSERKLLQIILLGQPELLDMLKQDNLRQFSQRITARFHLDALNRAETREYIAHRMSVAGGESQVFPRSAMNRIYRLSGGVPRVINLICDRSLLGAYAGNQKTVSASIVKKAAGEVLGSHRTERRWPWAVAALMVIAAGGTYWVDRYTGTADPDSIDPVAVVSSSVPVLQGHTSREAAWHDLFALWGAAFEDRNTPACNLAPRIGLQCYRQQATIPHLLSLNRPALVEINGDYFVISSIDAGIVTLIAGDRQHELPRSDFEVLYKGEVELLWRMPPAYNAPIQPNDTGAAVDWLVVQLSLLAGDQPPLAAGFVYDQQWQAQVRDFQLSVGLNPDGVVDPLTWIYLNSVEPVNIPLLNQDRRS